MGTAEADLGAKAALSPTASTGPRALRAGRPRVRVRQEMPSLSLMDQIAPLRTSRTRKKPHLAAVVASIVMAVGLWFVIHAVSGRVIWFW